MDFDDDQEVGDDNQEEAGANFFQEFADDVVIEK